MTNNLFSVALKGEEDSVDPSLLTNFQDSNKPLSMSESGLHVSNLETSTKLSKKKLSASAITAIEDCPASWLFKSFVAPLMDEKDPHSAKDRGTLFHKIMEEFFSLDKEYRTKGKLVELANSVLESDEFSYCDTMENRSWLGTCFKGYAGLGENPTKIDIGYYSPNNSNRISRGLETFIIGSIGDCKRDFLGFVDQLIVDPEDKESLIIRDWKTSLDSKKYDPSKDKVKGYSEQRQQQYYAEILRGNGVKVSGAQLVYPIPEELVEVDIYDEKLRDRAISEAEEVDKQLQEMESTNIFPFKPGVLCAWCPLAKACPKALILKQEKFQKAFESQPDRDKISEFMEAF